MERSHGVEADFLTRRQILRAMAGGALMCCGFSACGQQRESGLVVPDMPAAGELPQVGELNGGIDGPATATAQAERGEQIQIGEPPKPGYPPIPTDWYGDLILGGDRNGPKIVSITSDDGPTYDNGVRMANHMRDAGLEGLLTYFMVANNLAVFPDEGRQVFERGYGIANHSLTHASYIATVIASRIAAAQDVFASILGIRPEFFRSPGLTQGQSIQDELARLGMVNIFTTTNINDWVSPRISASEIVQNVERTIHPGNILLIHDGGTHQPTIDAMPMMIQTIRRMGYEIVRLEELLATGYIERRYDRLTQAHSDISEDTVSNLETEPADWQIDIIADLNKMKTTRELKEKLSAEQLEALNNSIKQAEEALAAS